MIEIGTMILRQDQDKKKTAKKLCLENGRVVWRQIFYLNVAR